VPLLASRGEWTIPAALVDVFVRLAVAVEANRVLDPWARTGAIIIPVAQATNPAVAVALAATPGEAEAGEYLSTGIGVDWRSGDPLVALATDSATYDLVVSCPPFGYRATSRDLHVGDAVIKDDYGNQIVAAALAKLSVSGTGAVVVSPATAVARKANGLLPSLNALGLHLHALLHLPNGFFAGTGIDSYLAIIRRAASEGLFVGEIRDLRGHNDSLLRNLKAGSTGPDLSLGKIVAPDHFRGYAQEVSQGEIQRLAQRSGLEPTALSDIAVEINLTKDGDPASFPDRENAIYLPLIGRGSAMSAKVDLSMKAHNYAQVVLDPSRALAPYLAAYFNFPLGRLGREAIQTATFIPKITKQSLNDAMVYIPEVPIQARCVDWDSRATNLTSEIEAIRDSLWARPRTVDKAYRDLESVNREDNLRTWTDLLPFPLASILWAYHASGEEPRARNEHLLHFFEALAEFHAVVLWSAVKRSPNLTSHQKYPFGPEKPLNYSLENSSFGSWVEMAARLAKFCRGLLGSAEADERDLLLQAFGTRNTAVLGPLFSSRIIDQLQGANQTRNDLSHGGLIGPEEAARQRVLLENRLAGVRSEIGSAWTDYRLLKAGANRFARGVFQYDAELVMGRSSLFERITVDVTDRAPII
jgi:hypothetical protein